MVTRRLTPEQFQSLLDRLGREQGRDMGSPYQTVAVRVDGCLYSLDLHLDNGNRVTVLQGVRARYTPGDAQFFRELVVQKRVLPALLELYLYHHTRADARPALPAFPEEDALLEEFRAFERTACARAADEVACSDPDYQAYLDRYEALVNEVRKLLGENGGLLYEMEAVKNAALSREADGAYQRGLRDAVVILKEMQAL